MIHRAFARALPALGLFIPFVLAVAPVARAAAQTDFYNTDRGRPLQTEDAIVIERRAFELQAAPFTFTRVARGVSHWGVAPELAWGFAPRTQLEFALPFAIIDDGTRPHALTALVGAEIELLRQINNESLALPAFALGAGVRLPAGPLAPVRGLASVRALATRTFGWGRMHVNGQFTPGDALAPGDRGADDATRWMAGVAFDHTFVLRSLLLGAELGARTPLLDDASTEWRAGVGIRQQLSPRLAMDAGVNRRVSDGDAGWALTMGVAFAYTPPRMRGFDRRVASRRPRMTVYEQFYLPADHNFAFRRHYPFADRLFNAFDYGHATLYEKLWTRPADAARILEGEIYDYLTTDLLNRPPRLPLVEDAIEPMYSRLVPEAKLMFEWAHLLHRQAYDILADERLDAAEKDREMRRVLAYYRSRPDLAFSSLPKNMSLMQEQPYSLAFRQGFPKFNGIIWAYHWLQVGLYEPLLVGKSVEERQAGVAATVARFRQMLPGAPDGYPVMMPMTAAVAPTFAAKWPELAIIFDNLHSMHDVISDVLANASVPRDEKRARILDAARAYRDDTTDVMTVAGWRRMAELMGVENQGGPAVGFLPALPKPTMARGAVMRHDKDGNVIGGHDHR